MNVQGSEIAVRIISRLADIGKSRQELADNVGFQSSNIANWKNKNRIPSLDVFIGICDFLGVSPKWLATGESDSGYSQEMQDIINRLITLNPEQIQAVSSLITTFYEIRNLNTKNAAQV